ACTCRAACGELDCRLAATSCLVAALPVAPTAVARTVATDEDTRAAVTLAGADVDGDPLTFAVAARPAHGTLSGTGADLTYTPDRDYNGPHPISYRTPDAKLDSATATVSID